MATVHKISYYAMYVIGGVESNWNWNSVNYNDPITIGMMQWFGTRAARLLSIMKEKASADYAKLAQSLRDSMDSHATNDKYWESRYLTKAEGESFIAASKSQTSHLCQEELAIQDFSGYVATMAQYGFTNDDPQPLVFAMCMWHQSPAACLRVIHSAYSLSLSDLYNACMADSTLGKYTNRYNRTYQMCSEWDGVSDPPDFGQSGLVPDPNPEPEPQPDPEPGTGSGSYIIERGSDLVLYGTGSYSNGLIFHASAGGRWIASTSHGGEGGGGENPEPPIGDDTASKIMHLLYNHKNQFAYGQGSGRLEPLTSGHTDCSGLVWWAYTTVANINVGTSTREQIDMGTAQGKIVYSGSRSDVIPVDNLKLADLILIDWGDGTRHVELYNMNDTSWGIRDPGGYGPNQWGTKISTLNTKVSRWWIARWL